MILKEYNELKNISRYIEDMRNSLFNNKNHLKNMATPDEFYAADDMFTDIVKKIDNLSNFLNLRS